MCLTTNPGAAGAAYGYPGMGGYTGAQTEKLLVPFADMNCLRLPGEPHDAWEHDFVMLADALPTAYHATELAHVGSADVVVIGAGLAGAEAAWQCARRGGAVELFEMRPVRSTPAHQTADFAELVCSNSLKSDSENTAPWLLKEEMRRAGSLIMLCIPCWGW